MTIANLGATGQLGGHIIDELIRRKVPAGQVLALGRNPQRLAERAGHGPSSTRTSLTPHAKAAGGTSSAPSAAGTHRHPRTCPDPKATEDSSPPRAAFLRNSLVHWKPPAGHSPSAGTG